MIRWVSRTIAFSSPSGVSRGTAQLRSFLLPGAALASLALGLAVLLDPAARVGVYIPIALFAIGVAVLSGSLSLPRRERPKEASGGTRRSSAVVRPSFTPPRPVEKKEKGVARANESPRAVIPGKGSDWRILSAPVSPADETWLSWLPRERRRLGPDEGGLVPGVVASPGRAGNLVAFPVRDYYGAALPRAPPTSPFPPPLRARDGPAPEDEPQSPASQRSRAGPPGGRTGFPRRTSPFSEEELDRLFPSAVQPRPVFLEGIPARVGGPSPWARADADTPSPSAEGGEGNVPASSAASVASGEDDDISVLLDGLDAPRAGPDGQSSTAPSPRPEGAKGRGPAEPGSVELSLEAANPIPPHLRAAGPLIRFDVPASAHRARGPPVARSVCASCSKVVLNLHMSGPCPKCLRPVCNDCLREALATVGRGWCLDCSTAATAAS